MEGKTPAAPGLTVEEFKEKCGEGAAAMGLRLEEDALDRFSLFSSELMRFNKGLNLVSRKEGDWVQTHFLDSLAPAALGLIPSRGRLLDLGSGAGFPGIPLKIVRLGLFVGLAEASGKKCAWLRHAVRFLGMEGISVMEGRFEDLSARGEAGVWDFVVSRAAARPGAALGSARAFLKPGGRVLIYTKENLVEKGLGTIHPCAVPGRDRSRVIWEVVF